MQSNPKIEKLTRRELKFTDKESFSRIRKLTKENKRKKRLIELWIKENHGE